jgi:type II secretory ATPase GspE/PulE/Tfp pilus assembly ATPase PilB-like protein
MTQLVKRESVLGCESCYKGYVGLVEVGEYLHNDHILRSSILNGLDLMNLKIEKNSDSWHNIFENSLYLLELQEITTNSIIKNLGYPKK